MGTNPFRRRPPLDIPSSGVPEQLDFPASSRSESVIAPIDTGKAKVTKTVRIISPRSVDSEPEEHFPGDSPSEYRKPLFSPPPESVPQHHESTESPADPFGSSSEDAEFGSQDERTRQNTIQNEIVGESDGRTRQQLPFIPSPDTPNPFKKSFTTPVQSSTQPDPETDDTSKSWEKNAGRPQYDVNDFTKLLLTGGRTTRTSMLAKAPTVSFGGGDSSSNTDTSSLSRQSLFETMSGLPAESPRTSRDPSPAEDERQSLMGPAPKAKPSTPRHRHGKLVKPNAPQTEEIAASIKDPAFKSERRGADAKDLEYEDETPPAGSSSSQAGLVAMEELAAELDQAPIPQPVKRAPPAPPAARRSGQSRPISMLSDRSISSIAPPSEPSRSSVPSTESNASPPPPPPPPRRNGTFRGESTSSVPTLSSVASSSDQSIGEDNFPASAKYRPPAPPARSPSTSANKNPRQTSPAQDASPKVAPLPPPRRRGSSQSSYTPSRLSGEYRGLITERMRSDSGTSSISQFALTPLAPMEEDKQKQDVMADLTALQREVDELRGKIGQ